MFTRRWDPDGPNEREQIYIANADGSNLQPIDLREVAPIQPTWFPDGRRILFLDLASTPTFKIVNADGSGLKDAGMPPFGDSACVFGDGKRVAVFRPRTPSSDDVLAIFLVRVDTRRAKRITRLRQLTHSSGGTVNNNPNSWSPDGTKIVFTSNRGGGADRVLFVMTADGSRIRQLTQGGARFASWGTHR